MANIDIEGILQQLPNDGRVPKTKIVCTLGPASRSVEMIEKLLKAGMNVARFNFSHGTHDYHQETLNNLKAAMHNTGILCAVMLDTKGPEIRTGFLKDGKPIQLKEGQEITITTDYDIKGDQEMIAMSYKKLPFHLKPGNTILCSDGTITLTVLSCDPGAGTVRCRCENTAMLGERKNVNLPGVVVDLPTLTEKDKEDILGWGVPNKIDMIALSFVRKGSDLVNVRKVLGKHAKNIMLMSKKMMIYKCNLVGKPVVTATQMLESMIKSPRPTRAEATDVANAVLDGTDCVMLSGESAAGAYPELAVKIMARICIEAESSLDYGAIFKEMIRSTPLPMSPLESLASSAVRTANKAKARLIVVLTRGGTTAKLVAKYRPAVPILSVVVPVLTTDSFDWTCSDETPARHSLIYRGLIPILAEGSAKATDAESTEVILEAALKSATEKGLCQPGDAVVALHRIGVASETLNNLKAAMHNTGILSAVMLDTKGPEIRTGFLKDGKPIQLKEGQEITITTDYDIKGDQEMISMSYKKLPVHLKPGNTILCSDGTITLTVLSCDQDAGTVRCRCENTAMLGERKNVNLPGVVVDLPTLTEKDKEDILGWGVPNNIDMIALSFVRKGSDLVNVRKVLGKHAKNIMLMSKRHNIHQRDKGKEFTCPFAFLPYAKDFHLLALFFQFRNADLVLLMILWNFKVENQEGVMNFDDILRETDAFMVARGDLGMEIPVEKIFLAQKMMIYKCNLVGKPVVTATQMLESMIKSPRPTRAEATDVANAVLDGTDCVMLSGESAAGAYPELAVKIMAGICIEAESSLDYGAVFKEMIRSTPLPMSPLESLASSAVHTANKAKAKLIVVLTRGGTTAKLVAKYRPAVPILSVVVPVLTTDSFDWTCSDESPARHSLIYRGLIPILAEGSAKATDAESTEEILEAALKSATGKGLCQPGDAVVALHRIGAASVIKICIVK
ncbi:Pyruvate/Phosphoenolpyruvate kinase-like domain superfamily [Sesbania bispinosa]|nr:Pyruvate/Phosphoenolpyruvate kinase-like domain superfamily [Sesbania bispinosa]